MSKSLSGALAFLISHNPSCRSLILEKPVVATLSCSPIQTARLLLAPAWPGPTCAGCSCRTSHTRSFLSRDVVTSRLPLALYDNDCTISVCLSVNRGDPASISQILTVKSPEEVARTFSAEGLKSTCPTFLVLISQETFPFQQRCQTLNVRSVWPQAQRLGLRLHLYEG